MTLFDNYQAYDIAKNMAATCLKDYDSYFISFYKLNNPTNQSEYYYVFCGNLEGEEGSYYFNGYQLIFNGREIFLGHYFFQIFQDIWHGIVVAWQNEYTYFNGFGIDIVLAK